MKRQIAAISFIFVFFSAFSQCIEEKRISYGGDWNNYHYTYFCPTFNFSFDGDTSKIWGVLNAPIDITQVGESIFPIKAKVESDIQKYAGKTFVKNLIFQSVKIVYPDSIEKFAGRMPFCNLDSCRAKFFFYYIFSPVKDANYHIGIAADDTGKILSEFNFPNEKDFKVIDTTLTTCRLIKIAEKYKDQIEPIDQISFNYDFIRKRFYWLITQQVLNEKEGKNTFNSLLIDACNSKKVRLKKGIVFIEY